MKRFFYILSMIIFSTYCGSLLSNTDICNITDPKPFHTIFSHGFGANKDQALAYQPFFYRFGKLYQFDYPHVDNIFLVSFAQKNEVKAFNNAITQFNNELKATQDKDYKIVIFGVSNGASNIIGWLAENAHNKDLMDHIAGVVLESPFDSLDSVLKNMWIGQRSILKIALLLTKYNAKYTQPINAAEKINSEIPILIIASKKDALIPWISSYRLYKKLEKTGHSNISWALLNSGSHANLAWESDGAYQEAILEFYVKHGLIKELK